MDFQKILSEYECKTCIMSVEIYPEGNYGNIRIAAGNEAHCADIKMITGHDFVPDTPYEMSFPQDMNFEDFCYRCAVLHQQLHTYVPLPQMGLWLELYMLPLKSEDPKVGYCLYSYNVTPTASSENMADLSPGTSAAILSTCIKLRGQQDFHTAMNEVIQDIRNICDAERCCVFLIERDEKTYTLLSDVKKEGISIPFMRGHSRDEFYKVACTWEETIGPSTCLIMKNEKDMLAVKEKNPLWYESLHKANIRSLAIFPLRHNNALLGYIWATDFAVENAVKIKEVLELTTFFLGSEIANFQLLNRLRTLSSIDLLTRTKNRNALDERATQFKKLVTENINTLAVLFADMNGLKRINDTKGHDEGDRTLKMAATYLRQIFVDEEIYRAGGDEFVIIALDITKEEVEKKLEELMTLIDKSDSVSFSIGYCLQTKDFDISQAMHEADEMMHAEKEAYYEKYPERRYR